MLKWPWYYEDGINSIEVPSSNSLNRLLGFGPTFMTWDVVASNMTRERFAGEILGRERERGFFFNGVQEIYVGIYLFIYS